MTIFKQIFFFRTQYLESSVALKMLCITLILDLSSLYYEVNCSAKFSLAVADLQRQFFSLVLVFVHQFLFPLFFCLLHSNSRSLWYQQNTDIFISAKSAYLNNPFGLGEHRTEMNGFKQNPRILFPLLIGELVNNKPPHFANGFKLLLGTTTSVLLQFEWY